MDLRPRQRWNPEPILVALSIAGAVAVVALLLLVQVEGVPWGHLAVRVAGAVLVAALEAWVLVAYRAPQARTRSTFEARTGNRPRGSSNTHAVFPISRLAS